jgi:sorbitol-specific phosphotransferase system component IIBC
MSGLDDLIKDAESALAQMLTARVVAGIVASFSWLGALSGPLGFIIGLIVGQLVKYGDWVSYHLGDGWLNSANAEAYQKVGEALDALPPTATKEEIDAAKKAKADALDKLMGAS